MTLQLNKIYNLECIEGMKQIPDKSVDFILCDLPYGTTKAPWDAVIPFDLLWEQYKRIIKDNAAIVLTASQPFTTDLINSNRKWFRYEWIWKKGEHTTGFQNANRMPLKNHENVLVFYKKLPTYNPQGVMHIKPKIIQRKEVTELLNGESLKKKHVVKRTNYPKSIVNFPRQKGFHSTQKPVDLFEYLIRTYTNEGDLVLDNCMGSGTTAIAALNSNRNFIGFEMNENFFNLANERIENHINLLN